MAAPRSFAEIVEATAQQKLAAAQARKTLDASAEKPKEAILDALHMVADAIAAEGYVFSPSGPHFVRKHGDFTYMVSIHSDHNNVAGQRAAIWVYAGVYSKTLTAWRKNHSSEWVRPRTKYPSPLFTSQLGYLCNPAGWVEWDFAKRSERQEIADDLVASIRAGAFPLFSTFEASAEAVAAILDSDLTPPDGILSYLLSTGHRHLADRALDRYLDKKPGFRDQFDQLFNQFSKQGLPSFRAASAHDLAAFSVATRYPWSETGHG